MLASGHSWRAGHSVGETFLLYPVQNVLLLFNTTRAHTPDPQAQMTEVWPTERYKYNAC